MPFTTDASSMFMLSADGTRSIRTDYIYSFRLRTVEDGTFSVDAEYREDGETVTVLTGLDEETAREFVSDPIEFVTDDEGNLKHVRVRHTLG